MLPPHRVATKPSALELAPIACAAGHRHISREATLAARQCIRSWLADIISASTDIMQAEHRQTMKLSDVRDGIRVCISRITSSFAEVYGSSDLTVRIEDGAYCLDDSAQPEPEELAAEQENDSDDDEGDDDFASEGESDDEVASEDLLCEEELSASDGEGEESDFELTPSSGEESTPPELRDEIQNMEEVLSASSTEDSPQLYKPAISPDTMTELIHFELNTYRIDIRISLELQYFIHIWLEQRLLESFSAAPDCDIVLMTAVYNGKRMPLGVLNELTKPQPPPPSPQRQAPTPTPASAGAGKKRRQALLTSYSVGSSEGQRMKGAEMSPIASSSPPAAAARAKRARPSDATQPADSSFLSNGDEDLDETFDHNHHGHQVACSSKDVAIPSHIGPELQKLRQSTEQLYSLLAEYNSNEPVAPLKQRIAELEAELAAVRQRYMEAQAALTVVARHAQGILAFCDAEATAKPSK